MTRENEEVEWMYFVYNDFNDLVRREGAHNVILDLEQMYPDLYQALCWAIDKHRGKLEIPKKVPALLKPNATSTS